MALSKEIQDKINEFSRKNEQDEIVKYLKEELAQKRAIAQDILDYARVYHWPKKPGKPYVISADIINCLGVIVGKSGDAEQAKLDIEFYKLAAERNSCFGNINYSQGFLKISPEQALPYAKKALQLTNDENTTQNANFYLAKCYAALGQDSLAWKHFCLVNDTKHKLYNQAAAAREELLKKSVHSKLTQPAVTEQPAAKISSEVSKKWIKESKWFDSVDEASLDGAIDADEQDGWDPSDTPTDHYSPSYREIKRRHEAEKRFFNPSRSKKQNELDVLTSNIITHRYKTNETVVPPVDLAGSTGRLLISSERVYQEVAKELTPTGVTQIGIPIHKCKPWAINGYSGETLYGPIEHFVINNTTVEVEHRADPKPHRLGDSFLVGHGNYNDIHFILSNLSNDEPEKEKKLAGFMIRYAKTHQGVSLDELKTVCFDTNDSDVNKFNQICFLMMEREQGQWHSATSDSYQLGMAVSQARCLILIREGKIRFKDAFKKDAEFGVYSQTDIYNNPDKVKVACKRIDKLYMEHLQSINAPEYEAFLQKYMTPPTCVLTREQAHQDLKQVYGGDSDTDDEGYDSDLSMFL